MNPEVLNDSIAYPVEQTREPMFAGCDSYQSSYNARMLPQTVFPYLAILAHAVYHLSGLFFCLRKFFKLRSSTHEYVYLVAAEYVYNLLKNHSTCIENTFPN